MSPAGIPYMYLGDRLETCIAEIKPNVNDIIWLGCFIIKKDLKLLDLSKIPEFKVKSIFDPEYEHEMRFAKYFMENFTEEISKPLLDEDKNLEYVPTQVLSEFIRNKGYDGIRYKSSQIKDGYNYTLFCGPEIEEFNFLIDNLIYFDKWMYLKLFKTVKIDGVSFHHSELNSRNVT